MKNKKYFNTTFEISYQVCQTNGSPHESCQYLTFYVMLTGVSSVMKLQQSRQALLL
jgi:hypothetical protein